MLLSLSLFLMLGYAAGFETSAESNPSPSTITETRGILDDRLVNYPETRFRNVRYVKTGFAGGPKNVMGFCGEMNTQNRMGGYTGWSPFFVSPTPVAEGAPDRLYVVGIPSRMDEYSRGFTTQIVATFCGPESEPANSEEYANRLAHTRS